MSNLNRVDVLIFHDYFEGERYDRYREQNDAWVKDIEKTTQRALVKGGIESNFIFLQHENQETFRQQVVGLSNPLLVVFSCREGGCGCAATSWTMNLKFLSQTVDVLLESCPVLWWTIVLLPDLAMPDSLDQLREAAVLAEIRGRIPEEERSRFGLVQKKRHWKRGRGLYDLWRKTFVNKLKQLPGLSSNKAA